MEPGNSHNTDPHNPQQGQLTAGRKAAINAFAIIGFVVLVVLGIMLAIYSSRFVPAAVNQLSTTSSQPATSTPLAVVSTSTPSTLPIMPGVATATPSISTTLATASTGRNEIQTSARNEIQTSARNEIQPYYGNSAAAYAAAQPSLYGLPNLTTAIIATGYLANGTTASFVPAQIIPVGARAAVQFSIANTGTNATGPWNFSAGIPTQGGYVFTSPVEQSMNPGDHVVFTLGFDQAQLGTNEPIVVTADPANQINETTKVDNVRTATITVVQS